MTTEARWLRRAAIVAGALVAAHLVLAYALDAMGFVESLFSRSGITALSALVLGLVFYVARLVLLFIMPGLLLAALVFWGVRRGRGA